MPEAVHVGSGKVRELFALDDDRLLLVASDRISTFDVVLPTEIPDKGRVLTGLSAFWFARTRELCPNHLLGLRSDGRSTECKRLEMLPIECVVRGYLSGSGWKDYRATGSTSGHRLPGRAAGIRQARAPDLHPVHQGRRGARREHRRGCRSGADWRQAVRRGRADRPRALRVRLLVRRRARDHHRRHEVRVRARRGRAARARGRGVHARLLALLARGRIQAGRRPGVVRQAVRARLLRALGWDKTPPGPELPDEVIEGTRARYVEAFETITGIEFDAYLADPEVVLS